MQISVKLFGAFRNLSPQSTLVLNLANTTTVAEIKAKLEQELRLLTSGRDVSSLISRSVLADESKILNNQDTITEGMKLAILPPVCGG